MKEGDTLDYVLFILAILLILGLIGFLTLGLQAWGISLGSFFSSTRLMLLGVEITLISFLISDYLSNTMLRGILSAVGIAIFFGGFINVDRQKEPRLDKKD